MCLLFFSVGNWLYSTKLEWGFKAGLVPSNAYISNNLPGITFKPITEYSFGSYLSLYLEKAQLGFQPEVHYSVKGFDAREEDSGQEISSKYKISYVEVPFLFFFRFPLKGRITPSLLFGPYVGFAQKVMEVQTAFGETEKRDVGDNLTKTDVGLQVGVDVQYQLDFINLVLGLRFSTGFVNLSRDILEVSWDFDEDDAIRNRAFAATLGVAFNLSRRN